MSARSSSRPRSAAKRHRPDRRAAPPSGDELGRRLAKWAEITQATLAIRGAVLLGGKARSLAECVSAGLAEANRLRQRAPR